MLNGAPWRDYDAKSVFLPYEKTPDVANVRILLGDVKAPKTLAASAPPPQREQPKNTPSDLPVLEKRAAALRRFVLRVKQANVSDNYELAHAQLALEVLETIHTRRALLGAGKLKRLSDPSQAAADQSYVDAAKKLCDGFEKVLASYKDSSNSERRKMHDTWRLAHEN